MLSSKLSTLWENKDGCDENYICAMKLYLLSMLSKAYYVVIENFVSATEHRREVLDGLKTTENYSSLS